MRRPQPDRIDSLPVTRFIGGRRESVRDTLVAEAPLTIILNGRHLATILCTPEYLAELAVGFLYSEGFIGSREDVVGLRADGSGIGIRVDTREKADVEGLLRRKLLVTPGCVNAAVSPRDGSGLAQVGSRHRVTAEEILRSVREVQREAVLYRETGGVHNAALCSGGKILFLCEDIGRHNALDKTIGRTLLDGTGREDKIVVTSGRVSTSAVAKMIRAGVPLLASRSAPTSEAARLAQAFGMALVGFARGKRFNVYSNAWRVV